MGDTGSNLVQYGSYDVETAEEELEQSKRAGGTDFMKLKEGDNIVRFLPRLSGWRSNFVVIYEHFLDLPGGGRVRFACPRAMSKPSKPCPICVKADKLKATGNQADFNKAKELFASRRIYANVIDRSDPEAGPKVLTFGKGIHEDLAALRKNPDWGGDFTHPETGFDIRINRVGSKKHDTEYTVTPRKPSPLGNMEWIGQQRNLEQYALVLTPEEMRAKIAEATGDEARATKPPKDVGPVVDAAPPRKPTVADTASQVDDDDCPF